ncbi:cysteine proteinase [Dothidotthia symphoricarpi CBS 119687]|uniref:Cysteine proteinase n=1 Tax=Dothidotthia symphoricarpi CBS 119687 TaxID=1392245 RepID=A0A6A6AHK7_9PLEO|nr:cysteine proteinase [Dothidotthia symphoricarpi CBS 119687]KAF2129911.1 cysteine proteinase [Dothidotthia symphoricarpi CBS 119687]
MDTAAQFEACKAAASNYRSQLQTATTKDEALTSAIGVAENLMKALKLSSSVEEKKQLKAQCAVIMDVADRIKNAKEWTPLTKRQPEKTKHEQIGQWAVNVANTAQSAVTSEDATSQSNSSYRGLSSTTLPVEHVFEVSGKSSASSAFLAQRERANASKQPKNDTPDGSALLTDLSHQQSPSSYNGISSPPANIRDQTGTQITGEHTFITRTPPITSPEALPSLAATASGLRQGRFDEQAAPKPPSTTSYSHVRKLAEPISSRKRSKKEDIILLKASVVNGFKCPPWDKNPSPNEFALQEGVKLYTDTRELSLSPYQQQYFQGWMRAQDAIPPPSMFPEGRVGIGPLMSSSRSIDLVQDAAADCSVVASLCAGTARAERGHDQMLPNKLYPFDKQLGKPVTSPNGKYIVRLNFNGCWRKVVIDDRLPVSSTHRLLHVFDRRNPALLWPVLLEKAYLKVRGGYDFPGSNSCSDLWTFTGWIPEQIFLQETDTVPTQLWDRMYRAFLYGDVLVTAGTGKMSTKQEREFGLEGQHSYVVLDMRETDHDRLLLVKNPWVEGKGWRGPRPAAVSVLGSSTSSGDSKNSLETYHRDSVPTQNRPHPATFWIGLEQVIQHFESLYLNWNPGLFRYRQDIQFEWTVNTQQSLGGCIVNHPQFAFSSKRADLVWFLLSRHFRDAPADTKDASDAFNDGSVRADSQMNSSGESPKGYMSVYVCNGNGERLYIKDTYLESSDYVTTPQCLLRWDIDANSTHTVVIDQDNLPPSSYTFSLSAFSNSPITLEPAMQKYPLQKVEKGAWTRQSAGGSTSSSRYFENPQYTLEVRERGSLAILLTSTNHEHPLHVKLALGHGKRLSRLQNRDVMVDSGDHRSGCAFAEMKDLQPGLYTIICSLFEAGQTGDYTLRIDSTNEIGLKQIPRDGAGLLSMKLNSACFGPNIHKIAAPLVPHRLASYTIIARFSKATSPRSADLGMLARSPLRLSVELGRGPERKFVIASERGEYADSATVRSESVNIEPGLGGDLWLVLDRLSGPGGPVEEWYDVEMYLDTPQACTVGVWRNWDD